MTDSREPPQRCDWSMKDSLMIAYHDEEWGQPCHDDVALFERLILEAFQAGLSWATILRKREQFRRAFEEWDVQRIAGYGSADIARLMGDASIVRNRLKIEGTIQNARSFLAIQQEWGSFDRYIWSFVGGQSLRRAPFPSWSVVPARTPESDMLAKELKRRGFRFVGSTMIYSFMQSVGIVNDHVQGCFRAAPAEP